MIKDYTLCHHYGFPPRRVFGSPKKSMGKIKTIVIHHTAGMGNWRGLLTWFLDPGKRREGLFKRWIGFTHFYIERTGEVVKAFPLTRWMYHSCSGKADKETIGIELIHADGHFFTSDQYKSLADLIEFLVKEEGCDIKTVESHDYRYLTYSGKKKGCPGPAFQWDVLRDLLDSKGIFLKYYE